MKVKLRLELEKGSPIGIGCDEVNWRMRLEWEYHSSC